MAARIHAMPVGFDNVYAVQGSATILIDGGQPGKSRLLARRFARAGVMPDQVELIILTHGHWDHLGCAAALKHMTGAPLAMHEAERDRMESGVKVMPRGATTWGRVFGVAVRGMMRFATLEPTSVDLPIGDHGMSLAPYGIEGRVVHTPGHSPGSLSVVLDDGNALVGDLAMNMFPLRLRPGLPIFAEQPDQVRASVEKVLALGAKTIYPAHGPSFPATVLEKALAKA